jgi:molybdopterin-binding protein
MNLILGKIISLRTRGHLSLVTLTANNLQLKALVSDTPDTAKYLQNGQQVNVLFKETDVIIGREQAGISLQNRFPCEIVSIEQGDLLSKVNLDCSGLELASIITTDAVEALALQPGDDIWAMIKTNEMLLSAP